MQNKIFKNEINRKSLISRYFNHLCYSKVQTQNSIKTKNIFIFTTYFILFKNIFSHKRIFFHISQIYNIFMYVFLWNFKKIYQ